MHLFDMEVNLCIWRQPRAASLLRLKTTVQVFQMCRKTTCSNLFRGEPDGNLKRDGVELGLSIKAIVESLKGSIELSDRNPHGLCVRLIFGEPHQTVPSPRTLTEERVGQSPMSILHFPLGSFASPPISFGRAMLRGIQTLAPTSRSFSPPAQPSERGNNASNPLVDRPLAAGRQGVHDCSRSATTDRKRRSGRTQNFDMGERHDLALRRHTGTSFLLTPKRNRRRITVFGREV
jgi:hypothetical protein